MVKVFVYRKSKGFGQAPLELVGDNVVTDEQFIKVINLKDVKGAATGIVRYIPLVNVDFFDVV